MDNIGGFRVNDAREIHRRVLGISQSQPALDNARNQTIHNLLYYLILEEDLDAATDPLTGYTQAIGRIIRYVQPVSTSNLNMEASATTAGLITLTNRNDSFSASTGDLLMVIRNGSEWSPITAVGGSSQRHAVVVGCLGGGYYTAQFAATPAFSIPSETGTGTGSGTGAADCDVCSYVTGGNEAATGTASNVGPATCGTLVGPFRVTMTGTGETIYCYDPRLLTLPTGGHIIIADLGDRVDSPVTGTGTGTGTGTPQEILWMVLTGTYNLVGIPDRFYECCDGVPYLVRCDTYITEGILCTGVEVSCPGTGA